MKIARILFKPKWQDKEATVRLTAVTTEQDPELVAALPELTRSDPDARVRLAALKRLGDYERWRERSTGDADADVRRTARATYIAMLCSDAASNPTLRRRVSELETLSPAEVETVATSAKDRELRAAALAMATRPALLVERAIADPDQALRLAALERVSDAAALERIAERARKTDKAVSRLARERLETVRIGSGDAGAIAAKARLLCERVEGMLRDPNAAASRDSVEHQWTALGANVPVELQTRFARAIALLTQFRADKARAPESAAVIAIAPMLEADPQPATDASENEAIPAAADASENEVAPVAADAALMSVSEALASRARFDAALVSASEESRREREQRQARLRHIEELVPRYAESLEKGDTASAQAVRNEIAGICSQLGATPPAVERNLTPLHARYAELKRWQHWSNQRRRRELCDAIEALPETGAHPDAIATRVREAREEWQRLDAAESGDGAAETSGLTRRFFAACQRALKPAQKYFEKRDAVRDTHRVQLDALLARADATTSDAGEWKAMVSLRHDLANELRSLDRFSPRDRTALAKRIKQAIAMLVSRIDAHASEVKTAKERLIAQAGVLSEKADRNSIRTVRELQQQWTALGEGLRGVDQKQWREFRAACDRVFAGLDAERKEREAQTAALAGRAQAIVDEIEALLGDQDVETEALKARRRELELRWREAASNDRNLDQRWRKALDALTARNAGREREKRLARYSLALQKYALLRELEHGAGASDGLTARWDSHPALIPAFARALDRRWERARAGTMSEPADADTIEAARDALVRMEFATGIASPAADRQRRMDYQVARLSARMRGTAQTSDADSELIEMLTNWFVLPGPLPGELEQRFDAAALTALNALP
jgi:DNA repair protein SbcC/Rad50